MDTSNRVSVGFAESEGATKREQYDEKSPDAYANMRHNVEGTHNLERKSESDNEWIVVDDTGNSSHSNHAPQDHEEKMTAVGSSGSAETAGTHDMHFRTSGDFAPLITVAFDVSDTGVSVTMDMLDQAPALQDREDSEAPQSIATTAVVGEDETERTDATTLEDQVKSDVKPDPIQDKKTNEEYSESAGSKSVVAEGRANGDESAVKGPDQLGGASLVNDEGDKEVEDGDYDEDYKDCLDEEPGTISDAAMAENLKDNRMGSDGSQVASDAPASSQPLPLPTRSSSPSLSQSLSHSKHLSQSPSPSSSGTAKRKPRKESITENSRVSEDSSRKTSRKKKQKQEKVKTKALAPVIATSSYQTSPHNQNLHITKPTKSGKNLRVIKQANTSGKSRSMNVKKMGEVGERAPNWVALKYESVEKQLYEICRDPKRMHQEFPARDDSRLTLSELFDWVEIKFPSIHNDEALMHAYTHTIVFDTGGRRPDDRDHRESIERRQVAGFLRNCVQYNKLLEALASHPADQGLDQDAFQKVALSLGVRMTKNSVEAEYEDLDSDGVGSISFSDFYNWYLQRRSNPEPEDDYFDDYPTADEVTKRAGRGVLRAS